MLIIAVSNSRKREIIKSVDDIIIKLNQEQIYNLLLATNILIEKYLSSESKS